MENTVAKELTTIHLKLPFGDSKNHIKSQYQIQAQSLEGWTCPSRPGGKEETLSFLYDNLGKSTGGGEQYSDEFSGSQWLIL